MNRRCSNQDQVEGKEGEHAHHTGYRQHTTDHEGA